MQVFFKHYNHSRAIPVQLKNLPFLQNCWNAALADILFPVPLDAYFHAKKLCQSCNLLHKDTIAIVALTNIVTAQMKVLN